MFWRLQNNASYRVLIFKKFGIYLHDAKQWCFCSIGWWTSRKRECWCPHEYLKTHFMSMCLCHAKTTKHWSAFAVTTVAIEWTVFDMTNIMNVCRQQSINLISSSPDWNWSAGIQGFVPVVTAMIHIMYIAISETWNQCVIGRETKLTHQWNWHKK